MGDDANAEHVRIYQERLQERAYALWQEAGSPEDQSEHFWRLAERTVKADEKNYDNALTDSFPASDPPAVARVLETAVYVSDLERSQGFYEKLFGWRVMLRGERMAALAVPDRQVLILFQSGATLEPAPTPVGITPPHGSVGIQHLCFAIDLHELEAWQQRLGEFGIVIESSLTWPQGATSVYFRDPDGHSPELCTPRL